MTVSEVQEIVTKWTQILALAGDDFQRMDNFVRQSIDLACDHEAVYAERERILASLPAELADELHAMDEFFSLVRKGLRLIDDWRPVLLAKAKRNTR